MNPQADDRTLGRVAGLAGPATERSGAHWRRAPDFGSPADPAVSIIGLQHSYDAAGDVMGDAPVLRNVNLVVGKGEFLVVVGQSGSGKTTLLNLVSGLIEPKEGTIEVFGKPPRATYPSIGCMFARDALMPWRTARRNVEFGIEPMRLPKAERRRRALEYLRRVGLAEHADRYPSTLSNGMRQRVALARTWAGASTLLLMDEPFSGLDMESRAKLRQELIALWEADRKTVIFVTHDLAEALTLGDRIIVVSQGEIVAEEVVPFERPRSLIDLMDDPTFRAFQRFILSMLAPTRAEAL